MAAKAIELGHRRFATQKDATSFFSAMLQRYDDGQRVSDDDAVDLMAMLRRHPEVVEKVGTGIDHFSVAPAGEYGTRCFWIRRTDGTVTDFSIGTCVKARGPTVVQEFREACRNAVYPTLHAAKERFFREHTDGTGRVPCAATGEMITWEESHIDHKQPLTFEVIIRTFLAAHTLEPSRDMLTESADGQVAVRFTEAELETSFVTYHRRIAQLQLVKARENLRMASPNRIRPPKTPLELDETT